MWTCLLSFAHGFYSNAPPTLLDQLNKEPSVPLRGIKVPLHLALTVSPLALLIPTNHVNAACGRPQMIEVSGVNGFIGCMALT